MSIYTKKRYKYNIKKEKSEKSADIAVNKKVLFCYYSKDVHLKFHDWRHEGRG